MKKLIFRFTDTLHKSHPLMRKCIFHSLCLATFFFCILESKEGSKDQVKWQSKAAKNKHTNKYASKFGNKQECHIYFN